MFRTPPPLPARGLPCPSPTRPALHCPLPCLQNLFLLIHRSRYLFEGSSSVQLVRHRVRVVRRPSGPRPCMQDGSGMEAIRSHSAANSKVAMELMMQLLAFLGPNRVLSTLFNRLCITISTFAECLQASRRLQSSAISLLSTTSPGLVKTWTFAYLKSPRFKQPISL